MTAFTGPFVPVSHPAADALFGQVVAAYRSARAKSAVEYLPGVRDGLARAYCTITGLDRQLVGDRARARALSDLGSADVPPESPSAEPSSNPEQEQL